MAKAFVPPLALFSVDPKLRALGDVAPKTFDDPNGEAGLAAAPPKLEVVVPNVAAAVVVVVLKPP